MHEYSLYGQVAGDDYNVMLQQLAGITRMQPEYTQELHLVFKSHIPPGIRLIPSATNSDRIPNPEVQRLSKMLSNTLHYMQLVGAIEEVAAAQSNGDTAMTNVESKPATVRKIRWRLEFRDTPEPGKQVVTSRQISSIPIDNGDEMAFMKAFGFEYASRYLTEGTRFYDQDTTLSLHRVSKIPAAEPGKQTDITFLDEPDNMTLVDGSGGYVLQASIEAVDGSSSELKDRATRQLMAMRETLKQAVDLVPGDRLALDTKIPTRGR